MLKVTATSVRGDEGIEDVSGWSLDEILASHERPLATPEEIARRTKERYKDLLRDLRHYRSDHFEGDLP